MRRSLPTVRRNLPFIAWCMCGIGAGIYNQNYIAAWMVAVLGTALVCLSHHINEA